MDYGLRPSAKFLMVELAVGYVALLLHQWARCMDKDGETYWIMMMRCMD